MCGIAGKVSVAGPVDPALIARMCGAIEHRGPDSRGVFLDEGVGLGAQRLRVIDLQTGDQPIFNEDRSVVVVQNGEIYNYKELRETLARRGHRFTTSGDTEVIAHLYEEFGVDFVSHLRGMFAIAVWDAKDERLVLARDRVGKKPLIYALKNDALTFASEIRAVLEDSEIGRAIDLQAIDAYLRYQYVPNPATAFSELKKLPPAHILVWERGSVSVQRYWALSFEPPDELPTREEAEDQIRQRVIEATRLRLRSDVPLGAFLSGGVDSSAVVAAMAKQTSGRVKTFSIGFDVDQFDERQYAREVADLYGTEHHEFVVEPRAIEILPKLISHFGEPFADNSAVPTYYVAKMAREHVTVALNGDGGDENFGGYTRYIRAAFAERISRIPRPVGLASRAVAVALRSNGDSGFRAKLDRETFLALMNPEDRYAWRMAYVKPEDRAWLYTDSFRAALDDSARDVIARPFAASDAADDVNRLIHVDIQTYLANALLVKMDITSMAHALEVRSPLLDHTLMEYVARLPGSWKVHGHTTKSIFKSALREWLPSSILDRPKWGFGSPIATWFRGDLRESVRDVLLDGTALDRGWFRADALTSLIDDHVSGRRDNSLRLWALLQLELWLRTFIDERREQTLAVEGRVGVGL